MLGSARNFLITYIFLWEKITKNLFNYHMFPFINTELEVEGILQFNQEY